MKRIALPIGIGDTIVSVNAVSYNKTIEQLIVDSQGKFWLQADGNGNLYLCTEVETSIDNLTGIFNNGSNYNVTSVDFECCTADGFVGYRPPRPIE